MNRILSEYQNGNCHVTIRDDGTKIRQWPDNCKPQPEFPESIDLKITNVCDMACPWCHESSIKHNESIYVGDMRANVGRILTAIEGLPRGVEIAIGGGNPLEHPMLETILALLVKNGLITSITVNGNHLLDDTKQGIAWSDQVRIWQKTGWLYGVGVSDVSCYRFLSENNRLPDNSVCHAVVGVDDPFGLIESGTNKDNILVLGYKDFGRGKAYRDPLVDNNIGKWRYFIKALLQQSKGIISFDNLALHQLDIQTCVSPEVWEKHYMGDDGEFTMYFDAVQNEYAVSSTSKRIDAGRLSLKEMFGSIQGEING